MIKRPRYRDMTAEELAAATREYDAPGPEPKAVRVPARARAAERRIRNAIMGRPRIGEGSRKVLITVEGGLLRKADKVAKARKMSRSQFVAVGLKLAMREGKRRSA